MSRQFQFGNFQEHPTNHNIQVYFFQEKAHAEHFEKLLNEQHISFETQFDPEEGKHYYGIHKRDDKTARKLNYLVSAKFRKPFISNTPAKYLLLVISLGAIALGIIGYIKSM